MVGESGFNCFRRSDLYTKLFVERCEWVARTLNQGTFPRVFTGDAEVIFDVVFRELAKRMNSFALYGFLKGAYE